MLENISMKQALDVWSDFEAAYYGKHVYGGTVAEIYGYRLMSYDPGIQNEHLRDKSKIELGNQAAAALCALLAAFKDRHPDCAIFLDSVPFAPTQFCLDHRCHVEIIRHEREVTGCPHRQTESLSPPDANDTRVTCAACNGTGRFRDFLDGYNYCAHCGGQGWTS